MISVGDFCPAGARKSDVFHHPSISSCPEIRLPCPVSVDSLHILVCGVQGCVSQNKDKDKDGADRGPCPFGEKFVLQSHDLIVLTLICGCFSLD